MLRITPNPRRVSSASAVQNHAQGCHAPQPAYDLRVPPPSASTPRWLRIRNSPIHGRGAYARIDIPEGTRIIEYVGEKITKAESRRREEQRLARLKRGGDGSVYIWDLNSRYDLDGRLAGNVARLINHSCAPNCRAETIRGHVWIIASRHIPQGEEITFDYGFPFSEWRLHPCRCGAAECVGFIVNEPQRWRVRRILEQQRAVTATG